MKSSLRTLSLATCVALAAALAVSRVARAAESTTTDDTATTKSLDDQLLRGLDSNLQNTPLGEAENPARAEQLADAAKPAGETNSQPAAKKLSQQFSPFDEALQKALSPGNTASGGPNTSNALAKIIVQMRQVQQRLAASKSDKLTQQQQQSISAELKSLLDQMAKSQCQCQCQGGQCNKPGQCNSQSASRGTPKPGNCQGGKTPAATASSQPAPNSTAKLRANQNLQADAAVEYDVMVKELDRLHLPSKDREAMLEAPADEFLPGHEESIGEYFKRLVEQEDK